MLDPIQYEFLFLFNTLTDPEPEPKRRFRLQLRQKVPAPCGSATLLTSNQSSHIHPFSLPLSHLLPLYC